MQALNLQDDILRVGMAHFSFRVRDRLIGYAYIRKNACSAFKKMICETSAHGPAKDFDGSHIAFMNRYHRIRDADGLAQCDQMIFVYRDPFDRLVSAYTNKFVVRQGQAGLFKNYQQTLGKDPKQATFFDFISAYCKDFTTRDVHVKPQARHLLPIQYDAAISISELNSVAPILFGESLARRYFTSKTNASTFGFCSDDATLTPAEDLYRAYRKTGQLPAKAAFASDVLKAICRERYHLDYRMLERIDAAAVAASADEHKPLRFSAAS